MSNTIPKYLNEKSNIIRLIVFTSVFALIFINIYTPFGSELWYGVSKFRYFVFSSLIILTGVLVVVVSRIIMFYYCKKYNLNYWQYALWIAAEIFFMALFYTLYSYVVGSKEDIVEVFENSVKNTSLVLLIPYSVSWLYFSWKDKTQRLEKFKEDTTPRFNTAKMIPFKDEKGELRLTVNSENLLYLEAADNYVNVMYLNKGKLSAFLIRNTLKNIEESLNSQYKMIARCHRSYMVNFEKVKIMRREKGGVYLELEGEKVMDIPVSKTYIASLTELLF